MSTAFEIFEKTKSVDDAVKLLLKLLGNRYQLDRVRIVQTNLRMHTKMLTYQWAGQGIQPQSEAPGLLGKEDFQQLYENYDEYGTVVIQEDEAEMFSDYGRTQLLPEHTKTVLYVSMYNIGRYIGYIAFDLCSHKRYWSKKKRKEISEVVNIIAANLEKKREAEKTSDLQESRKEIDPVTGLLSFREFRKGAETEILSGRAASYLMISADLKNFSKFNQEYGFAEGDRVLKKLGNYFYGYLKNDDKLYFTRMGGDHFLMLLSKREELTKEVSHTMSEQFLKMISGKYPGSELKLRIGIYNMNEDSRLQEAIDKANYARKQVRTDLGMCAQIYDAEIYDAETEEN